MRGTDTNMLVGGKLAISDCSQVTDGAAMVILASEKFVHENFPSREFPMVKGYGHRVAPMTFMKKMEENKDNPYILPWTRQAVVDAYNRAGMTIEDIDFFETHDCFTSSEYAAISSFGITRPGEEYKAIEDGILDFEGEKPINASGGLIGCGHPVGASGVRMFLDLYKQISGSAGDYQLKKADNGMMLNIGGSATTNYVYIIGK
jgi:acetyl-CoA C-acetyltransferase